MNILQFKPAQAVQGVPINQLVEAVKTVTAGIYGAHKSEEDKLDLAQTLMGAGLEKCLMCKTEGQALNFAAVERCSDERCPLHFFFPKLTGAVKLAIIDKGRFMA